MTLFGRAVYWHVALPALLTAFVTAIACTEVLTAILRRSFASAGPADRQPHARGTIRVVRGLLLLLFTLLFIPPVLDLFGQPLKAGLRLSSLVDWLLGSGLKIFFIVMFAYVITRVIDLATTRFERYLINQQTAGGLDEHAKRARTLGDMTRNVTTAVVIVIAVIYVLQELKFNPLPLLTGAGIAGLAIGFGAQTLVKDVISGFFLILENQIRIGDVAEINGTGGLVEAIHLRTVVLRDQRGAVHVIPCGSINSLANLTKDFAYAVLDVRVHYRHDTDHVVEVLRKAAATISEDPAYAASVFSPLEVLGVESLGDAGVTIRIRLKTLPVRQWEVARELRRRIKKSFDEAGIEIPVVQPVTSSKISRA